MAVTPGTKALGSSYDVLAGIVNAWFYDGCPTCSFGDLLQQFGWGGVAIPSHGIVMTAVDMDAIVDRCNIGADIVNNRSI